MSSDLGMNANECVEDSLDKHASDLENNLSRDVLSFFGPLVFGTDDMVRTLVESRPHRRPNLAVILETDGGLMEPVRRIVEVLRHHYTEVDFFVPSHAFSAGTILVMSGDGIHMDYYSNLGPIDPQVLNSSGKPVPALGYLAQYNRLLKLAKKGQASSAELAILLKFDQAELYSYEQERELSIQFLREWLAQYKFKNWKETETRKLPVTEAMRKRRAAEIAKKLNETERWHAHGTGINMTVLKMDLKLLINDFGADNALSKHIRSYHRLISSYQAVRSQDIMIHRQGRLLFA